MDNLHILRTNIRTIADRESIKFLLDSHGRIVEWNLDQEDIDCVLKITADNLCLDDIVILINKHGYECTELE